MDLQLTVPALLFPAISLLYLSYNGRFLALAQLIRDLHERWQRDGDETIYRQIQNLRQRLKLIRAMQVCGATSFILAASSMTGLFYGYLFIGQLLFAGSLFMLIGSVAYLLWENIISVQALELELGSLPRPGEQTGAASSG